MAYDAVDNLVKVTDALGNTVQTQYDALNNPRQVTDALGRSTTFAYDAVNRLTQRQDALKRITTFEYDNVDRLIASVDALTGRSSQAFDADGNRTALVDPNHHQTQFEFDCKGRLEAEISSAGGRQAYGYNARDLLTEITNARKQTRHIEYDALGQMTQISDADGPIHYGYDKNGNVLTITDDNGTISREYDALNRVIKYTDSQGNTLHYAYNEVGNLVTLTYPDNRQVHYDYDDANQLIQITDWAQRETHYEWDDNGRLIKETRPNGTVMTRRYDKAGQLLQQQDVSASGDVIAQFDFSYDAVDNITNETPALKPPIADATLTYTAANKLDTYNGQAVQFDADGNMIQGPLNGTMQPFQFDSRNRLSQIADTAYVYDAENQRIAVKSQGQVTQYVINPQAALSQVLVKTAPDGTPTYYVYGLGLIGEETNGAYQAYHYDLRGSTVALTDASGSVVDRFQYSAFAQLVHHEGSSDTPFLYNGRDGVMTDTNGLYYMRARYYSPEIRRFVNQDVLLGNIADGQSLNRFAYVIGNPVSYVDPLGLSYLYTQYASFSAPYVLPNEQGARTIYQYLKDRDTFNETQNCYTFGTGAYVKRLNNPYDNPDDPQSGYINGVNPGKFSGTPVNYHTCEDITGGVLGDGLKKSSYRNSSSHQRQVALVVATKKEKGLGGIKEQGDAHFYTPYNDYFWMHKRGTGNPSLFDSKGYPITNPETANRSYPSKNPKYNANYEKFCGYFSVPPNSITVPPSWKY